MICAYCGSESRKGALRDEDWFCDSCIKNVFGDFSELQKQSDKNKLSIEDKRELARLKDSDYADIGFKAVDSAKELLRRKRVHIHSEKIKFTGYYRSKEDGSQIYAMAQKDYDGFNVLSLKIKGDNHRVIAYNLNDVDRMRLSIALLRMLGHGVYHRKNGSWTVNLRKKLRNFM